MLPIPPIPLKLLASLGGVLILVAAVLIYGHVQYGKGKDAADAEWIAAGQKLREKADDAAAAADEASAARAANYQAELAAEQQEIEDAKDSGSSPLDVLFGE